MRKLYKFMTGIALGAMALLPGTAKALTVDDLIGQFSFVFDDGGYSYHCNTEVVKGTESNEIIFKNLYYCQGGDIRATVDVTNETITFYSEDDFWYSENHQGEANFVISRANSTGTKWTNVASVSVPFSKDGTHTINFPKDVMFQIIVPEGISPGPGFGGDDDTQKKEQIVMQAVGSDKIPMQMFPVKLNWQYNASEWKKGGTATFKNAWMTNFVGQAFTYEVDYMVNIENENKILLVNPFGTGTPFADSSKVSAEYLNSTPDAPGYIFIDGTNPEFVRVIAAVKAGYTSDAFGDFYCLNEEYYYTWSNGDDVQQVKQTMNMWGMYNYSYYNADEKTFYLNNLDYLYTAGKEDGTLGYKYLDPDINIATVTLGASQAGGDDKIPNAMPAGVTTEEYNYTGNAASGEISTKVKVAFSDNKYYIQGLCTRLPDAVVIASYDEATGTAIISQGQYLGVMYSSLGDFDVYTKYWTRDNTWETWNQETDPQESFVLNVNAATGTLTTASPVGLTPYLVYFMPEYNGALDYVTDITLTKEGSADDIWTVGDKKPYTMPEGVEPIKYVLDAAYEHQLGRGKEFVEVAFDGNYIYIKGLCYYLPDAVVRADYDKSTAKAYIPQGQLFGYYEGEPYFVRIYDMLANTAVDQSKPFILNVNAETGYISSPTSSMGGQQVEEAWWYLAFYNPTERGMSNFKYGCLELIGNIRLEKYVDRSGTPANPYDLSYDADFGDFEFMLPNTTTSGNPMDIYSLSYKVYLNNEAIVFQGPGYDEEGNPAEGPYTGTYGSELVPYWLNNDIDIISNGEGHLVTIYADDIRTLGVQLVYTYGDALHETATTTSEIITLIVDDSGVSATEATDVVGVEYFTLDGIKIATPESGIVIKRSTLSNGEVRVTKEIIRK